jgi:transposase
MPGAKPGERRPPYPAEMWEGAVRMLFEHQDENPSQWAAISSISKQLSVNHMTMRQWVRRAETDASRRPGLTTDERARLRELERENPELRRANEIADEYAGGGHSLMSCASLMGPPRRRWHRTGFQRRRRDVRGRVGVGTRGSSRSVSYLKRPGRLIRSAPRACGTSYRVAPKPYQVAESATDGLGVALPTTSSSIR